MIPVRNRSWERVRDRNPPAGQVWDSPEVPIPIPIATHLWYVQDFFLFCFYLHVIRSLSLCSARWGKLNLALKGFDENLRIGFAGQSRCWQLVVEARNIIQWQMGLRQWDRYLSTAHLWWQPIPGERVWWSERQKKRSKRRSRNERGKTSWLKSN